VSVKRPLNKAQNLAKHANPLKRGRQLLVEGYRKAKRQDNCFAWFEFEMLRSLVIQNVYMAGKNPNWLDVGNVKQEIDLAMQTSSAYPEYSMKRFIRDFFDKSSPSLDRLRVSLDAEANSYKRFLGSYRHYTPGVGYAVSLSKASGPNQDSFLIDGSLESDTRIFAVADGLGSQQFSSIASYLAIDMVRQNREKIFEKPKETISEISKKIAKLLNPADIAKTIGHDIGSTTLLLGINGGQKKKICKVGDGSISLIFDHENQVIVEPIGMDTPLANVVGQSKTLDLEDIEEYDRSTGKLVLLSDGVSNVLKGANTVLERLFRTFNDSVVVAEELLRETIVQIIRTGAMDDTTIVVQE
jgi:serine/threonine protein phosphatase PrpC